MCGQEATFFEKMMSTGFKSYYCLILKFSRPLFVYSSFKGIKALIVLAFMDVNCIQMR